MKRILCLILVLLALLSVASAEDNLFDECIPDYQALTFDVAIAKTEDLNFYASIDGSEMVEIEASPYPADDVGHIIVVDLAWGWTTHVNDAGVIRPIVSAYLNQIDRANQVKFICAKPNGMANPSQYMNATQAAAYVNSSLTLPEKATGKPMSTNIASAIREAFTEAARTDGEGPTFKSVFVLVDPANPDLSDSATSIRDAYKKTGNSFPVSFASVYVDSYMEKYGSTETAARVRNGMRFYEKFASENDTVLARLNYRKGDLINTSGIVASLNLRTYYRLNLKALHPHINYNLQQHEIVVEARTHRGSVMRSTFSNISTRMLPAPLNTATPGITFTPTVTPEPVITPEPPLVGLNDTKVEAKKAIIRLQQLYYLDAKKTYKAFDEECQYAFLNFCRNNGIEALDVIYEYAYELLMSDKAVPMPTATPTAAPTTPVPTASPTPTPFIYSGRSSTPASRLIDLLKRNYYLDADTSYDKWNPECMLALMEMCKASGIAFDEEMETVDQDLYNWIIESKTLVPKATATPVPSATPVSQPTVPPEGYRLGDTDAEDNTFIAQMQTILQKLNLYTSEKTVGQLDQATMDAVTLYCQQYGMALNSSFHIDKSIVTDILTNGENRVPYAIPEPSLSEKLSAFLQKDALQLGSFQVKMWMLIALVVVLIFIIILICILSHHKKEDNSLSIPQAPISMPTPSGTVASSSEDVTVPLNGRKSMDDEVTVPLGSGVNVTLTISGGPSQGVVHTLIGSKNYVIGRETAHGGECDLPLSGDRNVSRKHAALNYYNGQLFIHNLSLNGTSVNGHSLDANQSAADNEMTVPLNAAGQQASSAFALKRGDMIEICRYRIRIDW